MTLVGLGTSTFNDALDAISEIYGLFSRALPEGSLEPGDSVTRGEIDTLHVSNRLLTPKKDTVNMKVLQPPKAVDPRGILKAIIDEGEYLYCDENDVVYFECKIDGNEKKQ